MTTTPFLAHGKFSWLLGIEDTCVYPIDPDRPTLDEHQLTDHHLRWRDDLRDVVALGGTAVRYGMSWPLVHFAPGQFNWTHLDEVVEFAVDILGLDIIADLVHYGAPTWLPESFADKNFPAAIEEFAGALARRYSGRIRAYTPLNEPVTTASFAGLRGVWPPYRRGWEGWTSVVIPIAVGMTRASRAIRNADPDALIVHVEAATAITTRESAADDEASLLGRIGWLPTDLLTGRVDSDHDMWSWLLNHGAPQHHLDWLQQHPAVPDLIGVNYYPNLTPRRLTTVGERTVQVAHHGGADDFASALQEFAARYRLPLIVSETSIEGDDHTRTGWLRDAISTVNQLSAELDIRAFTWWPLFDFVDWSWAADGENVEEFAVELQNADGTTSVQFAPPLGQPSDGKTPFLRRMGLVRLEEQAGGTLDRVPTATAHVFARLTNPGSHS